MSPISAARRRSLSRRPPKLKPRARVVILCEGEKTEPSYLRHWKAVLRNNLVEIKIDLTGAMPKTLVEKAAEIKKEAKRDARRREDDNLEIDEVWCVFDVDKHPNLDDARIQANANKIELAISNPCFELWLTLHFQDQNAYLDVVKARALCCGHLNGYQKTVTAEMFELLAPAHQTAFARAEQLAKAHASAGRASHHNPSTGVGRLVDRMRVLSVRHTPT